MRANNRGKARRKGAAVIEFAVIAPLLFLLIFGMIEFGRAMMSLEIMTNAAREGARHGVLNGSTNSSVIAVVKNRLDSGSIPSQYSTIKIYVNGIEADVSNAAIGDAIKVEISIPYMRVSLLPGPLFMGSTTLSTNAVMRRE